MGVPLIPEYSHRNCPRGLPAHTQPVSWATGSHADIVITPAIDTAVFIREMHIFVPETVALGGETITLTRSGNLNGNTTLAFTSLSDMMASASHIEPADLSGTGYFKLIFEFKAPILIRAGQSPAETLELSISGTPTITGTLTTSFHGHVIALADLGFEV